MPEPIESSQVRVDGLNAYLSRPAGGSSAGMLMLPMITGIGRQIRDWADDFARAGVTALSWDPWGGRPSADETPIDVLFTWMSELDDDTCLDEQRRLLDHLSEELGCSAVGTIGWCLGGRFALLLGGRDHRLANVVAYHPTVPEPPAGNHTADVVGHCGSIRAPVMMLYPGADDLVPVQSFQRMQAALCARTTGASIVHVYPGAEHGFTASTRHRNPLNAEAFAISWPQVLNLIAVTTSAC